MRLIIHSLLFLCFALLCPSLSELYAKDKATAGKPNIGVFFYNAQDIYINSVLNYTKKYLEDEANLTIFDAAGVQTTQTEQLTAFLKQKVDAVAINIVDIKVSQLLLNMVRAKNIPVVFFNREPDLNLIKNYNKAFFVGTEASQASVIQGNIVAKLWKKNPNFDRNKDGICNFIMLQGGLDNPESLLRSRVSVQTARSRGVNMQQVGDTLVCIWDAKCAAKATKLALALYGDQIDFVISNNDDMAIGAIEALQEFGFNKKGGTFIPVVGIDAIERAKEAIKEGTMHGTVLQDGDSMAKVVATLLLNAIAEKPMLTGLKYTWDRSGIAIRIPYSAYE